MSLEQRSPVIKDDERPLPDSRFQVRYMELRRTLAKRRVAELEAELARTRACLDKIFASRFWRWASPIRSEVRALRSALQSVQRLGRQVCSAARQVWDIRLLPPVFQSVGQIKVSIVLPVHNDFRTTFASLKVIQEHTKGCDYEVIEVDDASIDLTPVLVPRIKGIVYLQNATRLGHTSSCSIGASAAQREVPDPASSRRIGYSWLDPRVAPDLRVVSQGGARVAKSS